MSQHVIPVEATVTFELTASDLLTEWLAQRVQYVISVIVEAAARLQVKVEQIVVAGFESHEEPTRELVITALIHVEQDEAALQFWDAIVASTEQLNAIAPPAPENADVRLASQVFWNE